jgi:hypothetical protein
MEFFSNISFFFLRRDQRDGYNFTQSEKSAGNYYPLVTGIIIKVRREKQKEKEFIIKMNLG